jgi:hypothetical protein
MHAEAGETIDVRRGTRAATTFRKLPRASPDASARAASSTSALIGRAAEKMSPARETFGETGGR